MRFAALIGLLLLSTALAADQPKPVDAVEPGQTLAERDRALLDRDFAALAPQRAGKPDLYVVGFAGDGEENVFRNEVVYLRSLFERRFGARGHVLTLINHPDSLGKSPAALATYDNLYDALARIGKLMDREQDLLLLYLTMHGTEDHELALQLQPVLEDWLTPEDLRQALDDAGIRNRVVVISACYSGGFVPALRSPDTLLLTAARADRASFGCGSESEATYFGRAWLIDGLNRTTSFVAAYDIASKSIAQRERREDFEPSLPQVDVGERIGKRLQAWESDLAPGKPVPYPYPAVNRKRKAPTL
ncbi:C13 family peptidase [Luteimonas sp. SX5]|uniref:C13 family peptidase n=1 Tax=Luteimonas galliterrae TaxID=2940486 RepID=A0ABT0MG97_9GAMM|nr:C13 family peptidase [Luteimonas galliterrae]MCL1633891.1 C13 family peptidase [Luteimonas galliterrae]